MNRDRRWQRRTPHCLAAVGCVPIVALVLVSLMDRPVLAGTAFFGLLLALGSYLAISGERVKDHALEDHERRNARADGLLHDLTGQHRALNGHGRHSS